MNTLIYIITGIAIVLGIGVSIWSFIDTRKRYYDEYRKRKQYD